MLYPENPILELTTKLPKNLLEPYRFLAIEEIFHKTHYRIHCIITEDLDQQEMQQLGLLLGTSACITLNWPDREIQKYSGLIYNIKHNYQLEHEILTLHIVPPYQTLQHHSPKGTYLNRSPTDIISENLSNFHMKHQYHLEHEYPDLEYTVQFLENSYQFLQRIMSEWGMIHWSKTDENNQPYLYITDTPSAYQHNLDIQKPDTITNQRKSWNQVSGFDHIPKTGYKYKLHPHSGSQPGQYFLDLNQGKPPVSEQIDHRVHYPDTHWELWYQLSWGRIHQQHHTQNYHSKNPAHRIGTTCKIKYRENEAMEHQLITKNIQHITTYPNQKPTIHTKITTQLGHQRHYPPAIERPRSKGPQIATVFTEQTEQMRHNGVKVRIHYPWDQNHKEVSTPWIPVLQPLAGSNLDITFTPRKNTEVTITYINDDYQRPLVQASLNNQKQQTWQNHTINGIETRTINQQKGKNQILFDDQHNQEQITITAQKDLKTKVKNDYKETIEGNQTIVIGNNAYHIIKQGNHSVKIEQGDYDLIVKQGKIQYKVQKSLTLETEGGKIIITPEKITLDSKTIKIYSPNANNTAFATTQNHQHRCPEIQNKTPHIGGKITQGSPNVYINDQPAATVESIVECQNNQQHQIQQGATGIYINNKPIARIGDKTQHGGNITTGSNNVIAGKNPNQNQPTTTTNPCHITTLSLQCEHHQQRQYQQHIQTTNNNIQTQTNLEPYADQIHITDNKMQPDTININIQTNCPKTQNNCAKIKLNNKPTTNKIQLPKTPTPIAKLSLIKFLTTHLTLKHQQQIHQLQIQTCNTNKTIHIHQSPNLQWQGEITITYQFEQPKTHIIDNNNQIINTEPAQKAKLIITSGIIFQHNNIEQQIDRELGIPYKKIQTLLEKTLTQIKNLEITKKETKSIFGYTKKTTYQKRKRFQLQIQTPTIKISGNVQLSEAKQSPHLITHGNINLHLDPLIGIQGTIDILSTTIEKSPAFAKWLAPIKKHIEKGIGNKKLNIKAQLAILMTITGTIQGQIGWQKPLQTNAKWQGQGEIAANIEFNLLGAASIQIDSYFILISSGVEIGAETGLGLKITPTDSENEPRFKRQFYFHGLKVYYSTYLHITKTNSNRSEFENREKKSTDLNFADIKSRSVGSIWILDEQHWPENVEESVAITDEDAL